MFSVRVRRALPPVAILSVLVLSAAACSSGSSGASAGGTTTTATAGTPSGGLVDDELGTPDWTMMGHDLSGQRRNAFEDTIGVGNVATLTELWRIEDLQAVTSTPAVVDGVVYFGDWTGSVRAVDAETGDERWSYEATSVVNSSPAVTADAVYAGDGGGTLHKIDRETGEQIWSVEVEDHPQANLYSSPIPVDDIVIQGIGGFEIAFPKDDFTFRGAVAGLDASTGDELWRVYLTEDDETSGAGVSVWSTPAVDTERKMLYIGTGNTYEEPTSPFSDSVAAIDYETGELVWSTQFTNPDVYNMPQVDGADGPDGDVGAAPNLFTVGDRDLVGAGDKVGWYHALDRESGDVVWETELTPGSRLGGVIAGGAVGDGRIYVASNVGDPASNIPTGVSRLFALDPANGEILWQADMELASFGQTTYANGVVYHGTSGQKLYAYDATSGELLWEFDTPGQVGGGASVVDGTVYWGFGFWVISPPEVPAGGIIAFRPEE